MSFESIQIQIQIQILTFESPRFRFNKFEFVELIQKKDDSDSIMSKLLIAFLHLDFCTHYKINF